MLSSRERIILDDFLRQHWEAFTAYARRCLLQRPGIVLIPFVWGLWRDFEEHCRQHDIDAAKLVRKLDRHH